MAYSGFYFEKAQTMRELARHATSARVKESFLKLARQYEELTNMAGETLAAAPHVDQTHIDQSRTHTDVSPLIGGFV